MSHSPPTLFIFLKLGEIILWGKRPHAHGCLQETGGENHAEWISRVSQ
jgi:hypothetical protein